MQQWQLTHLANELGGLPLPPSQKSRELTKASDFYFHVNGVFMLNDESIKSDTL
jgi:hypothetical protein